ncbi:STAS domain-containing protein [Catenuloplanes atrovinosus]|uniref:Anti-sigma factor antagonist n=1 Tax=Catenuloplanes atrovinosus TaxID=137266 RepID=A0AAE3YX47_9ACTN|nr:STAS domain-containing protein [Catenuloplanes atrovinosus]MDR7280225.1 anti-anti-sigma factor [Catenuloplanes atrovinosus]
MEPVSVSVSGYAGRALGVALAGEIDFSNADAVLATIHGEMNARRPPSVRVDLAAVTFLDSSGIGVLVDVMKLAHATHARFRVEHPSPAVRDQLRIAGLLDAFGLGRPGA